VFAQGGSPKVRTIGARCEMLEERRLLSFTAYPLPARPFGNGDVGGMATGADGNIWITENAPGAVLKVTPGGKVSPFPLAKNAQAGAITKGPDGNMWFVDASGGKVDQITTGGQIKSFAIPKYQGHSLTPQFIAAGADGNLWLTELEDGNFFTSAIGRMTPAGVFTQFPLPQQNLEAGVIAPGPDGNLWFSAGVPFGPVDLGRITPDGKITLFPFKVDTQGNFFLANDLINSIVTGPDGKLWVMAGLEIDQMNTDGTLAARHLSDAPSRDGTFPARLANLTVGSDGNFWFTTAETSNQISRMTPQGVFSDVTIPGGIPQAFPFGGPPQFGTEAYILTSGSDGNLWYLPSRNSQIVRFNFHNSILAASQYVDASAGAPQTNLIAKFIDTGPAKPASAYKATVTFDDGSTAAGKISADGRGGFSVRLTRNWPSGQSTPTIQISDVQTPTRTANASDFVTAVPLEPKGTSIAIKVPAGKVFTANVADFTDVDLTSLNQYSVFIDWGDGQQGDGDLIPDGKGGVLVSSSHGYAAPGSYKITVDLIPPEVEPRVFGSGPTPSGGEVISKAPVTAGVMAGIGNTLLAQAHHPVKQTEAYFKLNGAATDLSHFHATLEWADLFTNPQHPTLAMKILPRSGGMFAVQAPVTFDGQGVAYYRIIVNDDRIGMDDASAVGIAYGQILVDYPPSGSDFGVFLPTAHVQGAATNVEDDGFGFEDDFNPTLTERADPHGRTLAGTVGKAFSGDVGLLAGVIPNAKNLADLHATIEWGDGTTSSATFTRDAKGIIHVRGNHTYAKAGKYAPAVRCTQTIYQDGAPEPNMPDIRLPSIFSFIHVRAG
jgi:virginiamycin B lyase